MIDRDQVLHVARLARLKLTDEEVERSSHFAFAILLDSGETRNRLAHELGARGIQTTHYRALTGLSDYRDLGPRPRTEDLAARHLALPLSSTYGEPEVDLVVDHLTKLLAVDSASAR